MVFDAGLGASLLSVFFAMTSSRYWLPNKSRISSKRHETVRAKQNQRGDLDHMLMGGTLKCFLTILE
jgi:hypothetical protein